MSKILGRFKNFLQEEEGPTAVEYAILVSLLVVVCVTTASAMGS